jgi:hypothetical protein
MDITRDDNGNFDLQRVTPYELEIIAEALESAGYSSVMHEMSGDVLADQIRKELENS